MLYQVTLHRIRRFVAATISLASSIQTPAELEEFGRTDPVICVRFRMYDGTRSTLTILSKDEDGTLDIGLEQSRGPQ